MSEPIVPGYVREIVELRAEIERLRNCATEILVLWEKGIAAPIGAIARRALALRHPSTSAQDQDEGGSP